MAEDEVRRVKRWLDSTGRFRITHDAYALDPRTNEPLTHVRLPLLDDSIERFDLYGETLSEDGVPGNQMYIECKSYSSAGNQGTLYTAYLAICYSAFAKGWELHQAPPSYEFMWATTHPFSQTKYTRLMTVEEIEEACTSDDYRGRLGGHEFDRAVAERLSERLWLSVVNPRVSEMIMGDRYFRQLAGAMAVAAQ